VSINGFMRDQAAGVAHSDDQLGGSSSSTNKLRLPMMMFSQQNDLLHEQTLHARRKWHAYARVN
jgi:hypothetical protein